MTRQQMAQIKKELNLGKIEWIDPEYVTGETLRQAVQQLGRVDVVYAEMGNTYNICHHLHKSGGAELVRELVMSKGAVYVGASAGSIMAGRTIQMAFWKDWDDRTCEGTVSCDWTNPATAQGLNIAGGRSIFPHANGQYAQKEWQEMQARRHGHTDHEVVPLADGEGLVIVGDVARRV